jgi:hypothetical protein
LPAVFHMGWRPHRLPRPSLPAGFTEKAPGPWCWQGGTVRAHLLLMNISSTLQTRPLVRDSKGNNTGPNPRRSLKSTS